MSGRFIALVAGHAFSPIKSTAVVAMGLVKAVLACCICQLIGGSSVPLEVNAFYAPSLAQRYPITYTLHRHLYLINSGNKKPPEGGL